MVPHGYLSEGEGCEDDEDVSKCQCKKMVPIYEWWIKDSGILQKQLLIKILFAFMPNVMHLIYSSRIWLYIDNMCMYHLQLK